MNTLTTIKDNEVYVSSKVIAQELNRAHNVITRLIEEYIDELSSISDTRIVRFERKKTGKGSKGRPWKLFYLNEEQFIFLVMNMRTRAKRMDAVMQMKIKISKDFTKMRKWILEQKTTKANEEYTKVRASSKISRRLETDIIKNFIEYATKQGSKSAKMYYMNISKMENNAFFLLKEKFPNVREILSMQQLGKIVFADMVVGKALIEGMEAKLPYKEIYTLAKERVLMVAGSIGIEEIPGTNFKPLA